MKETGMPQSRHNRKEESTAAHEAVRELLLALPERQGRKILEEYRRAHLPGGDYEYDICFGGLFLVFHETGRTRIRYLCLDLRDHTLVELLSLPPDGGYEVCELPLLLPRVLECQRYHEGTSYQGRLQGKEKEREKEDERELGRMHQRERAYWAHCVSLEEWSEEAMSHQPGAPDPGLERTDLSDLRDPRVYGGESEEELRVKLRLAVAALPAGQRAQIPLLFGSDKTMRQLAAESGLCVGALGNRKARLLSRLRRIMGLPDA